MPAPRLLVAARKWQLSPRSYSTAPPPGPSNPSTPTLLRSLMRRVAQPVSIITTHLPSPTSSSNPSKAHNHGATLSSVTSISLSPPLIAFSLRLPSRLASHLLSPSPTLTVHLMGEKGEGLARTFARQPSLPALATPSSPPSLSPSSSSSSNDDDDEVNTEVIRNFVPYPPHLFESLKHNSLGSLDCTIVSSTSLSTFSHRDEEEQGGGGRSELFIARVERVNLGVGEGIGSLVHWEQSYKVVE